MVRERADLLARVELLAGLDRLTLAKLAGYLEPVPVAAGGVLFQQGEPGDALYLVSRGTFGVHVAGRGDGEGFRVRTLHPGDPVGEMALFTNQPRTATIQADEAGEVLRLDRGHFLKLVNEQPSVALASAATVSRRLAQVLSAADGGESEAEEPDAAQPEAPVEAAERPAAASVGWRPSRLTVAVALGVVVLAAGWGLAPPAGLAVAGWHALIAVLAVLPALVVGALPEGVLGLLLVAIWVLGDVVPTAKAMAGFASAGWMLVVSVLVVGGALASSGLLYRLALWTVARSGGSHARSVVGLALAGVLMSPGVPNATGRIVFVAPLIVEVADALGYAPRSRGAAGLAMATLIGFGQMAGMFLTSSTTAVLVYAVLPPASQQKIDWVTWAAYAAPVNLILLAGLVAAILWLYRFDAAGGADTAKRQRSLALQQALLGPISTKEWSALAVGAGMLLGFAAQPLHGFHPGWIAVLALAALATARLVTAKTLQSVNWSFALLFGTLASLSGVFAATGVDRWMGGLAGGWMGGITGEPALFLVAFAAMCFAVSLVIRWQASAPLVTIAMAPVAAGAGVDPLVVGIIAVIACNGFFLPYQSTTYLALYHGTGERLFSHAQARPIAFAYGAFTLVAVALSVPAWRMMGLL